MKAQKSKSFETGKIAAATSVGMIVTLSLIGSKPLIMPLAMGGFIAYGVKIGFDKILNHT